MKKALSMVLAAGLSVAILAGCNQQSQSSNDKIYRIGGIAPLTGDVSVYGISTNNGVLLAVEEINAKGGINGMKIEYTAQDDKGDTTEATNAYALLKSKHKVDAIIGAVTSNPSVSISQRAAEDGMPMITPTGTADAVTEVGKSVFRTCFTDSFQGKAMAQKLQKMGKKSAAILYDNGDNYAVALTKSFVDEAGKQGLKVPAQESFSANDTDFKAQLTKIMATQPEVLFVPNYYEKNALILQQAKSAGFKGLICGGDGWDGILTQFTANPKEADGVLFSNHYSVYDPSEKVQNFITSYKKKYQTDPTAFSALGYDTVYLLKQAVEEAGSKDKAKVTAAIKQIHFSGVTGTFTFDDKNNPVKTVTYIQIKDGKYQIFTE